MLAHRNRSFFCSASQSEVKLAEKAGRGLFSPPLLALPAAAVHTQATKQSWQGALSARSSHGAGMQLEGIQCRVTAVWDEEWASLSAGPTLQARQHRKGPEMLLFNGAVQWSTSAAWCSSWQQPEPPRGDWKDGRGETVAAAWCGDASPHPSSLRHQKQHSRGRTQLPAWLVR